MSLPRPRCQTDGSSRRGRLFAVVGPSGAGKDTLLAGALALRPDLALVRRVITRPEAAGGEGFEGTSAEDFALRKAAGEFALDWQAHGLCYGIPLRELAPREAGRDVLFNGSRAALGPAQARFPDLRLILISAPIARLAERLAARGRESQAGIEARLGRSTFDLPPGLALREVVNDGSRETGIARLLAAIDGEARA